MVWPSLKYFMAILFSLILGHHRNKNYKVIYNVVLSLELILWVRLCFLPFHRHIFRTYGIFMLYGRLQRLSLDGGITLIYGRSCRLCCMGFCQIRPELRSVRIFLAICMSFEWKIGYFLHCYSQLTPFLQAKTPCWWVVGQCSAWQC